MAKASKKQDAVEEAVSAEVSVDMTRTKETKNTFVYDGPEGGAIARLYVPKETADKLGNPENITVTLTAGDE